MRFCSIFALILIGMSSPAFSSCDGEVRSALGKFWRSGPFLFVSQEWNINFIRQTAGKIVPGKAKYITLQVSNGNDGGEEIFIGDKSWTNDGLGWIGPIHTSWDFNIGISKDFQFIKHANCIGDVELFGRKFGKFTYDPIPISKDNEEKHTIYVDPLNGHIVRHEINGNNPSFVKSIATFRFDNSIQIEPPLVDPQKRNEKSIRIFEEVVEKSDLACRQLVSNIIKTAQIHLPFEFDIKGRFWSGVDRVSGKFIPPYSINYFIHGVPRHGGNIEIIVINEAGWNRRNGNDWSELGKGIESIFGSAHFGIAFPQLLIGENIHIGSANCEKSNVLNSDGLLSYAYNLYVDGKNGRILTRNIRMYVDPKNNFPMKFEILGIGGQIVRSESRLYNSTLSIKPPQKANN